jgi:TatD DNase family protein
MLIDTHCHLCTSECIPDKEEVISRAKQGGVAKMVSIACHTSEIKETIDLTNRSKEVFAAIGIHPCNVSHFFSQDFEKIKKYVGEKKVVGIGETGFDFFRETNPPQHLQEEAFLQHKELAKSVKKPLIVHVRNANHIARKYLSQLKNIPFVVHCFCGDWEFAKEILDYGGMLSFTGIVTFKNADEDLIEVVKNIPLDRIMVETDAPFLAPMPFRGKQNEPAFVKYTAEKIAEFREIEKESFFLQTTHNAERFFSI